MRIKRTAEEVTKLMADWFGRSDEGGGEKQECIPGSGSGCARRMAEQILSWVFTMLIFRGPCYISVEIANAHWGYMARWASDPPGQFVWYPLGSHLPVAMCVGLAPTVRLAVILCVYMCIPCDLERMPQPLLGAP